SSWLCPSAVASTTSSVNGRSCGSAVKVSFPSVSGTMVRWSLICSCADTSKLRFDNSTFTESPSLSASVPDSNSPSRPCSDVDVFTYSTTSSASAGGSVSSAPTRSPSSTLETNISAAAVGLSAPEDSSCETANHVPPPPTSAMTATTTATTSHRFPRLRGSCGGAACGEYPHCPCCWYMPW